MKKLARFYSITQTKSKNWRTNTNSCVEAVNNKDKKITTKLKIVDKNVKNVMNLQKPYLGLTPISIKKADILTILYLRITQIVSIIMCIKYF